MPARSLVIANDGFSIGTLIRRVMALFLAADLVPYLWYAIKDWPLPWRHVLGESHALAWLSGLQLSLAGWLALAIALVMGLHRSVRHQYGQRIGWMGVGTGFLLLAADESLGLHERLQAFAAQHGVAHGHGLLLGLVTLSGVLAFGCLLPQLMISPPALRLFAGACALAGLSQAGDAVDLAALFRLSPVGQKTAEMAAGWLKLMAEVGFILAFLAMMAAYARRLVSSGPIVGASARSWWD